MSNKHNTSKHKYIRIAVLAGVPVLLLGSIFVPVSINKWTGETQVISYTTRREGDASLSIGKEYIKQTGIDGQETSVYQTRRNIWQVISDKLLGKTPNAKKISSIKIEPTEQVIGYGIKSGDQMIDNPRLMVDSKKIEHTSPLIYNDSSRDFDDVCDKDWLSIEKQYDNEVNLAWRTRDGYMQSIEKQLSSTSLPEKEKTSVRFRATVTSNDMANKIIDPAYADYVSKLAELKNRGCKFYTQSYPNYADHSLDKYLE